METSAGQGARGTGKSVKGRIRKIPSESVMRLWRNFFVMVDYLVRHLEEALLRLPCLGAESNHRHGDFQSPALPTELPRQMATRKGLEPSTSSVTGWHSNRLNYRAIL